MAGVFAFKGRQDFQRIPIDRIAKNPNQPRRLFDAESLASLAESIRRYGVITPLTVRRLNGGFELVAGERRLRAARLAGLETVPCYIVEASAESSGLMALLENLQRQDLDFFEEAAFLRQLCDRFGMTQQQAAERIGRTQSAVANKLRLLRLSPETVETIRDGNLTERHARALLRLPDEERQLSAARQMVRQGMNVERGEKYIESLLTEKSKQKKQFLIRDVRIFLNTVERAAALMRKSGTDAAVERRQEGDDLIICVRVPSAVVSRETGRVGPTAWNIAVPEEKL
ncbi:MAG: ParB/RepB/Spo0J family partition protein [Clostridiaceae bacterium]|nr:ParB/RepB/Spo0J family partition protein [Clostridiaceae bacterium]